MVALLVCRGGVRTFAAACGWRSSLACLLGALAAAPGSVAMLAHRRILSGLRQLAGGFGFRLSSNSLASSGLIIATLAMRGPREAKAEFSFGSVTSLVIAVAGGMAGAGVAASAGALWGVAGIFAAGVIFARLRRLRFLPPSRTIRPYSATRARLVLTPCCCSKSAIAE